MNKVFISFSNHDQYFVNLLLHVLEFHHISNWCSLSALHGGEQFKSEIGKALSKVDSIIVVVSKNSNSSKWVAQEVATFKALKPEGKIIPILLDPTPPEDVLVDLSHHQSVDFTTCLLTGFQNLFSAIDKAFLPLEDRRTNKKERRDSSGQGMNADRRTSTIGHRMREGFWDCYSHSSRRERSEELNVGVNETMKIIEILKSEVRKFSFYDANGDSQDPHFVLEKSAHAMRENMTMSVAVKAIYVIEAIAEEIYKNYEIRAIDRRGGEERRS